MNPADILVDNPVLNREFRGRLRARKLSGKAWRLVAAIVILIVIRYYYVLLHYVATNRTDDAFELWRDTGFLILALICLLSPAMAATAISQEQEQQTWDLLKVTRLSGWQVIAGKWLARQTIPAIAILIALPLEIACALRGNVGIMGFAEGYGYLIVTAAFFTAMGLWCSSTARKTAGATAVSLLLMGVLCLGTCLVDAIISSLMPPMVYSGAYNNYAYTPSLGTHTMWVNPFYAFTMMTDLLNNPTGSLAIVKHHVVQTSVAFEIIMTFVFLSILVRRYGDTTAT